METITGIVTRFLLPEDPDTGKVFLAIEYETPNGLQVATMNGFARNLKEGDGFIAEGSMTASQWNGKAGQKFNAKNLRHELPRTTAGIKRFLTGIFSLRQHGISEDMISKALEAHGKNLLQEFVKNPKLLLSLSKSPDYHNAIMETWVSRTASLQAISEMESSGLNETVISRVMSAIPNDTLKVLKTNPYVAAPIPRVGFESADRLGRHFGIGVQDRRRLLAAVSEVLVAYEAKGSTTVNVPHLLNGLRSVSGIGQQELIQFLREESHRTDNDIAVFSTDTGVYCSRKDFYNCEANISNSIARILEHGRRNDYSSVKQQADELFRQKDFAHFDAVQRLAVSMATVEPFSIVTGGPGTGKSTVMDVVARICATMEKGPLFLVAPTGKAAKRLAETTKRSTSTLHRLLKAKKTDGSGYGRAEFQVNKKHPLPPGSVVVVDEASMLDVEMTSALFSALPSDGRIIFVGDRYQLPSVGPGAVLSDLLFSRIQEKQIVPSIGLVKVYRTGPDSGIAHGAVMIRDGIIPDIGEEEQGGVTFENVQQGDIAHYIEDLVCRQFPEQDIDFFRDVAVLCPQAPDVIGSTAGTWEINRQLSARLNPNGAMIEGVFFGRDDDERMPLPRVGDRIMMTENDDIKEKDEKEKRVTNGDLGFIIGTGRKNNKPTIKIRLDDQVEVEYPASEWRKISLAYAGTVHKSQGSQYKIVIMPVVNSHRHILDRTLLYTGWTRAQNRLYIIGEDEAYEHAVTTWKGDDRTTMLRVMLGSLAPDFLNFRQIDWEKAFKIAEASLPANVTSQVILPRGYIAQPPTLIKSSNPKFSFKKTVLDAVQETPVFRKPNLAFGQKPATLETPIPAPMSTFTFKKSKGLFLKPVDTKISAEDVKTIADNEKPSPFKKVVPSFSFGGNTPK